MQCFLKGGDPAAEIVSAIGRLWVLERKDKPVVQIKLLIAILDYQVVVSTLNNDQYLHQLAVDRGHFTCRYLT